MKFSILTATYNRAKCLPKLYESLIKNKSSNYEIEWLIMDDGSKDETENLIKDYIAKNEIEIKFFKQQNQGKMTAINNLAQYVTGEIWIECDSDDYFTDGAFDKIKDLYEKNKKRKDIYAFAFLKIDQNGNNMGNTFKKEETTMFDLYFKEGGTGEKALAFITEVRKKYRYELEHNERFVTEARMYHKMDKDYKMICSNEYMMVCEYQEEGYTKNIDKEFVNNPFGYYMYFYEILNEMDMKGVSFGKRLYVIKHFILFGYLTGQKSKLSKVGVKNKILIIILWIPGQIKSYKYKNGVVRNHG